MSTLRQDPTTKDWIIVAPRRAARPHFAVTVRMPEQPEYEPNCPFCPGNEGMTPPELHRVGNGTGWHVRVVGNMFPALNGQGSTERAGAGLFREMSGIGSHEVVIETPRHNARMDQVSDEEMAGILLTWRERYRQLKSRQSTGAVIIFKNSGPMAGTSLIHPHSQVVATPVLPPDALRRFDVARSYFNDTGRWLYDDLISAERTAGSRVVAERGRLVAFVPFGSPGPFETWVAPTHHQSSFGDLGEEDVADLGWLLRQTLRALRLTNDDPDYNLIVASAPVREERMPWFSWHIKLLPRLTMAAGFELGSGMSINPVLPEDAAAILREALAADPPG
jgi:UDPglucose--hexose-1-phosphate uridylyltransferase